MPLPKARDPSSSFTFLHLFTVFGVIAKKAIGVVTREV